jgi:hypothetical protein
VIVFPTFLFLCCIVVELALMWSDRHVVHLAAFEAARAYVTAGTDTGNPCGEAEAQKAAKSLAVRRMAAVSPSPAALLNGIVSDTAIGTGLADLERALDNAVGTSVIGASLKRWLVGLPAAWALTRVSSCKDLGDQIEVEVTWLRAPKVPYAGSAIWATFVLRELGRLGLGQWLTFDLDQYYFGVKARSPNAAAFAASIGSARASAKKIVTDALGAGLDLKTISGQLRALPSGSTLADTVDTGAGAAAAELAKAPAALDGIGATSIGSLSSAVDDAAGVLTAAIYVVAKPLRLIPMRAKVTIAKRFTDRREGEEWDKGQAFLIAPFHGQGTETEKIWRKYAEALSQDTGSLP